MRPGNDLRASGIYRLSGMFPIAQRAVVADADAGSLAPLRRRGLRRRLSAILIAATLGPVIAVSVVAVVLIFSSVEQGIEFETVRGLQVARSLFLQEVQEVSARAGDDRRRSRAAARGGGGARPRSASGWASCRWRGSPALLEVTDAAGDVIARCARGACDDLVAGRRVGALQPADRSPVILRALAYERTVSIESAGDRLVVRAALPLADPALRLLGALVVSVPVDGLVADRLKAALGAGRDVIIYRNGEPSTSTFMAATGARLVGPRVPREVLKKNLANVTPVYPLEVAGHAYSVAFGQLQDVNAQRVGLLGVAVDRGPLAAARRRASTALVLGALLALLLAIGLAEPARAAPDAAAARFARGRAVDRARRSRHQDHRRQRRRARRRRAGVSRDDPQLEREPGGPGGARARAGHRAPGRPRRELGRRSRSGPALGRRRGADRAQRQDRGDRADRRSAARARAWRRSTSAAPRSASRCARWPGEPVGRRLAPMAEAVAALGWPRRTSAVEADPQLTAAAAAASGLVGPMIAAPLSLKERVVGVILVGRLGEARFEEADLRLLVTFADQTATAIENARLYSEVRAFSENLELKVRERTAELEHAKGEIEYALRELGAAQGALIHSERMAALGMLVAGIAHEVNSPAAAVQGLVDALQDTVRRLGQCAHDLYASEFPAKSVHRYFEYIDGLLARDDHRVAVVVAGCARARSGA